MSKQTITVLGGTGKTGRRVATQLHDEGHHVRVASRRSPTQFDWTDGATWAGAITGADAVYIVPHEAPDGNEQLETFTRLAVTSGVRQLVFLSAREWVDTGLDEGLVREEIVRASGTGWTILRPVWFAQNFSEEAFLAHGINDGELTFGTGEGRHPFIDTEDIAAVAAAALTDDGHHGQHYELTGPRAITMTEAVETIAAALGRPIGTRSLDTEEYREHLVNRYLSAEAAEGSSALCELIRRGEDARLSDGVQRALGRQPREFAAYVRTTAAAGLWTAR